MKDELKREMGRCQQLFNAVAVTVADTNEWEDATVESDAARHCFRDMVNDYIILLAKWQRTNCQATLFVSRRRVCGASGANGTQCVSSTSRIIK